MSKICEQQESFLLRLRYLENDNPAALVSGGEELSILVELHAGDDISCNKVRIQYCTLPTGRRPSTEKKHNYRYYATRNSKLNYPQVGYRQAASTVLDDFIYFDKKKTRSVQTIIKNTVTGTLGNCVFPSHVSKGINYYAVARNL